MTANELLLIDAIRRAQEALLERYGLGVGHPAVKILEDAVREVLASGNGKPVTPEKVAGTETPGKGW